MAAAKEADIVFGCVDNDGARLVLTELTAAYERPYIDVATDVPPGEPRTYGGRVVSAWGNGCPVCVDEIDLDEARRDLAGTSERANEDALYGVRAGARDTAGPSVVCLNGVVASLAVMEFMAAVTGLRTPCSLIRYRGDAAERMVTVRKSADSKDCYYCHEIRGKREQANVERFLVARH